ncbi:MAG: S49 family peptidase [Pseudomonadota bacterium]
MTLPNPRPALARLGAGQLALARSDAAGTDWLVWADERASRVLDRDSGGGVPVAKAHASYIEHEIAPYEMLDGVAIIPVRGLLVKDHPFIGSCWATGYAQIRWQISLALADDRVGSIVLWIETGGGYVDGLFDLTPWIREAREIKPIYSIVDGCACSAGYAIAATAHSIVCGAHAAIGSIGVLCVHWDFSKLLDEWGVHPTLLFAGAHKVDGNPFQPLPDEVATTIRGELEEMRQVFAADVAAGRNGALTVEAALGTEAQVYGTPSRVETALTIGLIDAIATPDEALSTLVDHQSAMSG